MAWSRVRIPLEAWIAVRVLSVFVLSCAGSALATELGKHQINYDKRRKERHRMVKLQLIPLILSEGYCVSSKDEVPTVLNTHKLRFSQRW
jgi:hypothetical protein